MSPTLRIKGARENLQYAEAELPGSKSCINRLVFMAALQNQEVPGWLLEGQADDTRRMLAILEQIDEGSRTGTSVELDCRNAATVMRMAGVYGGLRGGDFTFTGSEQLFRRPVREMAEALAQLGTVVIFKDKTGFPPFRILSGGFNQSAKVSISATESSQHLSGLLMAGAVMQQGLTLQMDHPAVSFPYVAMTLKMMQQAGARVEVQDPFIVVHSGGYPTLSWDYEPDWSSAGFIYQAVALLPKPFSILLKNLKTDSIQGDSVAAELFAHLGVISEKTAAGVLLSNTGAVSKRIEVDFTHCPDLFNAFCTAAALLKVKTRCTGYGNLVHKESNRLRHLTDGLEACGYDSRFDGPALLLGNGYHPMPQPIRLDSGDDHRIAMSLALIGLRHEVHLSNPGVVSKSFPGFYAQLEKIARTEWID